MSEKLRALVEAILQVKSSRPLDAPNDLGRSSEKRHAENQVRLSGYDILQVFEHRERFVDRAFGIYDRRGSHDLVLTELGEVQP